MPFPFFAHQAAVVPFKRWWPRLSGTGLVLGSMAPDFGYFLIGASVTRDWHRPHGVLLYCLPVALGMYLVITRWLIAPLARHLPRLGRFRLHELAYLEAQPRTLAHLANVAACVVIGGATHLAWDLFTHDGTWMGDVVPWLREPTLSVAGRDLRGTNVLWTVSTVVGGMLSVLALRAVGARGLVRLWAEARQRGSTRAIDPEAPAATSHLAFWAPVVAATLGMAAFAYLTRPPGFGPLDWATGAIVFLRSAVVGFLVLAISAWRERRAWRHRSPQAGEHGQPEAVDPAA